MDKPDWLSHHSFSPVIKLPEKFYVHDFSRGEDLNPTGIPYSVGRYNEKRNNMYTTDLFVKQNRNIHVGVDIAAPVGEPVCTFFEGEIFLFADNRSEGNYGPTIITRHNFSGHTLYALFGHLSRESLSGKEIGQKIKKGEVIGSVGSQEVNGGWFPHLHFQLSLQEPLIPDMPGVVSESEHKKALEIYPDPRWVLGPLY